MPNNLLLRKQFLLIFREGILIQGGWKCAINLPAIFLGLQPLTSTLIMDHLLIVETVFNNLASKYPKNVVDSGIYVFIFPYSCFAANTKDSCIARTYNNYSIQYFNTCR
jgi:hypothetical protein